MRKHSREDQDNRPLDQILREQEEALYEVISKRSRWYRFTDPELLRVLGRLLGRLGEVRRYRLLRRDNGDEAGERRLDERLSELLRRSDLDDIARNVSNAWDYERELQLALYDIANDSYIRTHLIGESAVQHSRAYAPYGPWAKHLDVKVLDHLLREYKDGRPHAEARRFAVECLTYLYNARHELGRYYTLNTRLKTRYLYGLMLMMASLLVLLLCVVYVVSNDADSVNLNPMGLLDALLGRGMTVKPDFKHAVLAAATGALGSVMSGFYKLRDKGKYLSDLRSFRSAMLAQPFVGACIGLLLFLIVRSGILGISFGTGGGEWAAYSIFGFLGGFSEPFFLGIVESVARKGERDARAGREDDAAGREDGGDGSAAAAGGDGDA